jgi:hypothetical protein
MRIMIGKILFSPLDDTAGGGGSEATETVDAGEEGEAAESGNPIVDAGARTMPTIQMTPKMTRILKRMLRQRPTTKPTTKKRSRPAKLSPSSSPARKSAVRSR